MSATTSRDTLIVHKSQTLAIGQYPYKGTEDGSKIRFNYFANREQDNKRSRFRRHNGILFTLGFGLL